jgi:hypothetical protein
VATGTGRSIDLTEKDTLTERNHLVNRTGRNGKVRALGGGTGIGMSAFRGFGVISADLARACQCAGAGGEFCGTSCGA